MATNAPRDAATVILLRPDPAGTGFTTYLVKRAQAIAFMGGAHVFPGGKVDPKADASLEAAGCREVREEAGIALEPAALRLFARWVTPEVEPKRFDARFYVAAVPPDSLGEVDEGEIVEGVWLTPQDALAKADAGEIALPPPTYWNLLELRELGTVAAILAEAERRAARGIASICPRVLPRAAIEGRIILLLPGDAQYEDPEHAPDAPPGKRRRFELVDGGRWAVER